MAAETMDVDLREAWQRMARAAVRVCVLIHGDNAQGIGIMLDELRHTPTGHWLMLAKGFEQQLERHQHQDGHGGNATFENGPESTIAPMAMPTYHPGAAGNPGP